MIDAILPIFVLILMSCVIMAILHALVVHNFFLPELFRARTELVWQMLAAAWVLSVCAAILSGFVWLSRLHLAITTDAAGVFSPADLWRSMSLLPRTIAIILFIMAIWSLAVIIDRVLYFSAARKQSREFASRVAGALKEGRLDDVLIAADRSRKSHLAEVVTAGLNEFRSIKSASSTSEQQIEASKAALKRSEKIVHAKLLKGLSSLSTIGSTAPFIGLLGIVVAILGTLEKIAEHKLSGVNAVGAGLAEALATNILGLAVAIPAVLTFNYFTEQIKRFDGEMNSSSDEVLQYIRGAESSEP